MATIVFKIENGNDVKVLAEDDTSYAVSGALEGWDYVVTKASKPIEDGTLVRLKD